MPNFDKKPTRRESIYTTRHSAGRRAARTTNRKAWRASAYGGGKRPGAANGSAAGSARPSIYQTPDSQNPAKTLISRRGFLYGAVGVAALVASGGIVSVVTSNSASASNITYLDVSESRVTASEDCEYLEDYSTMFSQTGTLGLPFGTLIWAGNSDVAACLVPTETGSPLTNVGVIDVNTLGWVRLLYSAVGESEGFEIYDVRATTSGIVWTECDIMDGLWRIYTATLTSSGSDYFISASLDGSSAESMLGTPILVAKGNSDWETPAIAAWDTYAYWQELPKADGSASTENSLLKRCAFGDSADDVEVIYESSGRMACAPSVTDGGIVFAPRADAGNVYYQLTYIDGDTCEIIDRITLPASMKPSVIAYGKSGFSFGFDGIYSYGGGIANLGTYTLCSPPETTYGEALAELEGGGSENEAAGEGESTAIEMEGTASDAKANTAASESYSESDWFRLAKTPYCSPAWCGDYFVVKSSTAIACASLENANYTVLDLEDGAPSYGEYLASEGVCECLLTYTQIDYTPISGDAVYECRLKTWTPVDSTGVDADAS